MSFSETVVMLLRQWRLSLPALLLSLVMGVAAGAAWSPEYRAEVNVLLLPAAVSPETQEPVNPFLGFGGAIGSTGDILARLVTSPSVVEELADQGATADFEVAADPSTTAPVLLVTAEDRDRDLATDTVSAVVLKMQSIIEAEQDRAGAPSSSWITTSVLLQEKPERLWTPQIRVGVVVAAATALFFLGLIFLKESWLQRRRTSPGRVGPAKDETSPRPTPPHAEGGVDVLSQWASWRDSMAATMHESSTRVRDPQAAARDGFGGHEDDPLSRTPGGAGRPHPRGSSV